MVNKSPLKINRSVYTLRNRVTKSRGGQSYSRRGRTTSKRKPERRGLSWDGLEEPLVGHSYEAPRDVINPTSPPSRLPLRSSTRADYCELYGEFETDPYRPTDQHTPEPQSSVINQTDRQTRGQKSRYLSSEGGPSHTTVAVLAQVHASCEPASPNDSSCSEILRACGENLTSLESE